MATDKLPPLPTEAAGYGRGCNVALEEGQALFTAEQMRAYGQASRQQALEEAAKLCETERDRTLSAQTTSGDTTTDLMLRQVAYLGFDASAAAIRAEIDK